MVMVCALAACGKHAASSHDGGTGADADVMMPDAGSVTPSCSGHVGFPGLPLANPFTQIPTSFQGLSDEAVGDLDGDGILDLLITETNALFVAKGRGDGTFEPGTLYVASPASVTYAIHVADVNGDGKSDVVVANTQYNTIGVFLNQGGGVLAAPATYAAGTEPEYLDLGDLNGDGYPDVAVMDGDTATPQIRVLLNDKAGGFGTSTTYSGASFEGGIVVKDVNGDGKPDVIAGGDSAVSVYINQGTGALAQPVSYSLPFQTALAVGDVTGDGKPDIVARAGSLTEVMEPVSVLANNGDGTFAAHVDYPAGQRGEFLKVVDLDGDGRDDVVTDDLNDSSVLVLHSEGSGGLAAPVAYYAKPDVLAVGDVNGDRKPDILSGYQGVQILLNHGDGTFPGEFELVGGNTGPTSSFGGLAVFDADRDGHVDLLLGRLQSWDMFPGNASGDFGAPRTVPIAGAAPIPADLNGDDWPDLVMAAANQNIAVYLNDGTGNYGAAHTSSAPAYRTTLRLADVNRDGKEDLVSAISSPSSNSVDIQLGDGTGAFAAPVVYPSPQAYALAVGDLDHDGWPDAVVGTRQLQIATLLNQKNGTFGAGGTVDIEADDGYLAIADLNHDGKPDVVTPSHVLLGNGDGTLQAPTRVADYALRGLGMPMVLADLDGDQNLDLVAAAGQDVYVLYGRGDGTFAPPLMYMTAGAVSLQVLDVDGDQRPDIVTGSNDGVSVLRNTCTP